MTQPQRPDLTPQPQIQVPQVQPETLSKPQPIPPWRFWTPLALQLVLLLSVPAQSAYTYATGTSVTLQTAPVDPYDFLRGYYQTLNYEISDRFRLESLPGGKETFAQNPQRFYVVLQAPDQTAGQPGAVWQPVQVSPDRPKTLAANQVAIRGNINGYGSLLYGLESYYMPEDRRDSINQTISELQQQDLQAFVVETRIDARGNAVPVSLKVGDETLRF